jgi:hypothetical protein
MSIRSQTRDGTRKVLFLVGGGLALALPLVWLLVREHDPATPIPASAPLEVRVAGTGAALPASEPEVRLPLARASGAAPREVPKDHAGARSSASRKEREYYADYLALEQQVPGSLDAHARNVLAGQGPAAEKVALLRAVCTMRTPLAANWLELAVRAPGKADARGESVASFALEQLGRHAVASASGREALQMLCLGDPLPELALRRRATAKFAAVAGDDGLARLAQALLRESDELVIASALSSLRGRPKTPAVQRILDLWPERAEAATVPEHEEAP